MPEPAQRFLEYVFLALLYLFFLRVVRAVWVELKEPRLVAASQEAAQTAPAKARGGKRRAKGASWTLTVIAPERGGSYPLGDEVTIGRAPGCAVGLTADNFVSQVHARVFRRGEELWVEDLGSTNGTLVNGRRTAVATPLHKGDRVQVGRTVLELQR